jgi:hypothetical protein
MQCGLLLLRLIQQDGWRTDRWRRAQEEEHEGQSIENATICVRIGGMENGR